MQLTKADIKNSIDHCIAMLPDRVRIFMAAMYIWACILYYITKFANFILMLIITYLPNLLIPSTKPKIPITVLKAFNEVGSDITDKLNLFMKFKWDDEICDDRGGIDLDTFSEYINSSIIWVSYILNYDVSECISKDFIKYTEAQGNLKSTSSTDDIMSENTEVNGMMSLKNFKKCIRFIVINTTKKIVYKLKTNTDILEEEDILFGEIDFF